MQNDFGSNDGMLDRSGIDISGIQKTIISIANVINAARKSGIEIIYLKEKALKALEIAEKKE